MNAGQKASEGRLKRSTSTWCQNSCSWATRVKIEDENGGEKVGTRAGPGDQEEKNVNGCTEKREKPAEENGAA